MFCFHFRAAVRLSIFTCNRWGIFHFSWLDSFAQYLSCFLDTICWTNTSDVPGTWWGHKAWDPGLEVPAPISHTRLGPLWTLWHLWYLFYLILHCCFLCALFHLRSVWLVNQELLVILELKAPRRILSLLFSATLLVPLGVWGLLIHTLHGC